MLLSDLSRDDTEINTRIKELFAEHSESLIADLLTHPDHHSIYQKINSNFRQNSLHTFQKSITFIQSAASLFEHPTLRKPQETSYEIDKNHFSENRFFLILQNFSNLKLPEDIEEIRTISHPYLRTRLMATIINRDNLPIENLKLTKNELMAIGPDLTYLDCNEAFDDSWSKNEIHSFLDTCINLKTLRIHSKKITRLPDLELCKMLDCSGCLNLTELKSLKHCKALNCSNCASLRRIPDLLDCKTINCSDCPNLIELGSLPQCENFNCSNCPELLRLPLLPLCQTGIFDNCRSLDLNSLPLSLQIFPTLNIHLKTLNENPIDVLLSLEPWLIRQRILPKIQFIELDGRKADGNDAGGVFRIFISRLLQSLISHSEEKNALRFTETSTGLYMPIFDLNRNLDMQMRGFKVFGALFSLCYEKALSEQRFTTGIYFDRKLFDIISSLSYEELNDIDINDKELPSEIKLNLMILFSERKTREALYILRNFKEHLTPKQFETLRTIVVENLDEEEKIQDLQKVSFSTEEIKALGPFLLSRTKDLFLKQRELDEWLAPVIIAKLMQLHLGTIEEWDNLRITGPEDLDSIIQGTIDKGSLWAALKWHTGDRNLSLVKIADTKFYMRKWINEASFKDLESLSNFISGSSTINPSKSLFIQLYDTLPERLPTTHSCSFELDLSINYPSYIAFKEKLELALANVNSLESSGLEII